MDKCVKCAACIPVCPSYRVHGREGFSPRGRIALVQGLVGGELSATGATHAQLDACLFCRACERVCPSGVAMEPILDAGVALSVKPRPERRWLRDLLIRGLSGQGLLGTPLPVLLHWASRLGRTFRRRVGLPEMMAPRSWPELSPAKGEPKGHVALFLGCAARSLDQRTLRDGLALLQRWGFEVWIPPDQGCCGSLALHGGDPQSALAQARVNRQVFAAQPVSALISTASGCGRLLGEYEQLPWPTLEEQQQAGQGLPPVVDISDFLLSHLPVELGWKSDAPLVVALHTPCSLRNPHGATLADRQLLESVPGLEIVSLPAQNECCGAGGLHRFSHREQSRQLAAPMVDAIRAGGASILVSSNYGCALHLQNQLTLAGLELEVMHPVSLLNQRINQQVE